MAARLTASTSRRFVLTGGAAALALAAGTSAAGSAFPAGPDAGLIALCADLDAMQRNLDALFDDDGLGMDDDELEAADAAAYRIDLDQRHLLNRICTLQVAGLGGCRALARSLAVLRPDLRGVSSSGDMDVRLTAALVRGLIGEGA